jgi:hypothetical protein
MYQRWRILDILDTPPDLLHRSDRSDTVLEIGMSMEPTPPLSLEGWLEIMKEIENPPPNAGASGDLRTDACPKRAAR